MYRFQFCTNSSTQVQPANALLNTQLWDTYFCAVPGSSDAQIIYRLIWSLNNEAKRKASVFLKYNL